MTQDDLGGGRAPGYFAVSATDPEALTAVGKTSCPGGVAACRATLDRSALGLDLTDAEWQTLLAEGPVVRGAFSGDSLAANELWRRAAGSAAPAYLLESDASCPGCARVTPLDGSAAFQVRAVFDDVARRTLAFQPVLAAGSVSGDTFVTRAHFVRVQPTQSRIQYVVVIEQENHTFDTYFGDRCQGAPGVSCNQGWGCCERVWGQNPPWTRVVTGAAASELSDQSNGCRDPDHGANTELGFMHDTGGAFAMDRYPAGGNAPCSNGNETSIARYTPGQSALLDPYWQLAESGALADRYFQPIAGASTANDMFLARASFVYQDNYAKPNDTVGGFCNGYDDGSTVDAPNANIGNYNYLREYQDPTIGDLLATAGVSWATYMEGYATAAGVGKGACPVAPASAPQTYSYPFFWDDSDNPFNFYPQFRDNPTRARDFARLDQDLQAQTLPRFVLIRSLGSHSEHPEGSAATFPSLISDGEAFVSAAAQRILSDPYYGPRTLVLVTWDEGGGFYDHVPPPRLMADGTPLPRAYLDSPTSTTTDGTSRPANVNEPECYRCLAAPELRGQQFYGTRVPLLALGPFAKKGWISHAELEHSSIVKFVEWNYLGGSSGQLGTRDGHVNNLGSLLSDDTQVIGQAVPGGFADR